MFMVYTKCNTIGNKIHGKIVKGKTLTPIKAQPEKSLLTSSLNLSNQNLLS